VDGPGGPDAALATGTPPDTWPAPTARTALALAAPAPAPAAPSPAPASTPAPASATPRALACLPFRRPMLEIHVPCVDPTVPSPSPTQTPFPTGPQWGTCSGRPLHLDQFTPQIHNAIPTQSILVLPDPTEGHATDPIRLAQTTRPPCLPLSLSLSHLRHQQRRSAQPSPTDSLNLSLVYRSRVPALFSFQIFGVFGAFPPMGRVEPENPQKKRRRGPARPGRSVTFQISNAPYLSNPIPIVDKHYIRH